MDTEKLKEIIQIIVSQACELKNKHTAEKDAPVNYAAIFSQNQKEYEILFSQAKQIGKIVLDTPTGPVFQISPLNTAAGQLKLLKIRIPDKTRPEQGDADFTVPNYNTFKKTYLDQDNFSLIEREEFEMIELMDPKFNVRAYFSHPPLDQQLGIS
ncbi:MAG: hypothetical protein NTX00_01010 [Candidatus Parcubacteria bacterium]|nr:hypothetical protein [Candidatus Parcubacteria bacterium]